MKKKLYSLLVGIDNYHPLSDVTPLNGCKNDVVNFSNFLTATYKETFDLQPQVLLRDSEATYKEVIRHLGKGHLAQAGEGDSVLFYFSGHGTQEPAAKAFKPLAPNGLNEALICFDSGKSQEFCLADKELRILLYELQKKGVHLTVVLDCCHSGSGTRGLDEVQLGKSRQFFFPDLAERPFETYLDGYFSTNYAQGFHNNLPLAQHILLAACDRREKAYELTNQRGLFSLNLLLALENSPGTSYADLYTRCRAGMFRTAETQHPQFEPLAGFNPYQKFLGVPGEGAFRRHFLLSRTSRGEWSVNAGGAHGLPTEADKPAVFEVWDGEQSLGVANAAGVGFQKSLVELSDDLQLDPEKTYSAKLRSLQVPPVPIALTMDEAGAKRFEPFRKNPAADDAEPVRLHLHFELVEGLLGGKYGLEVSAQAAEIRNLEDQSRILRIVGNGDGEIDRHIFKRIFEALEHVGEWEKRLNLQNRSTHFQPGDCKIVVKSSATGEVLETFADPTDPNVEVLTLRLEMQPDGESVRFNTDFELVNTTGEDIQFQGFFFTKGFPIYPLSDIVEAYFSEDFVRQNESLACPKMLEFFLQTSQPEIDQIKFILSRQRLDEAFLLQMGELPDFGETLHFPPRSATGVGADKAVSQLKKKKRPADDWFCKTLVVKILPIVNELKGEPVTLAGGAVKITAPADFRASLSLSSSGNSTRDVGNVSPLRKIFKNNLFALGGGTRDLATAPLDVLEISGIQGTAALATQPLRIELDAGLDEGECLVPFTFDGEFFLPVGKATRLDGGKMEVSISKIPPVSDGSRSLLKALKLCFCKMVLRQNANQLRWVEFLPEGIERRPDGVAAQVAVANKIALVLHGIIGDTEEMAASLRQTVEQKDLDLVLTYDYENLNTPIGKTAEKLRDALADLAQKIQPARLSDKKIIIVAHSMGGLVSRHFIEYLGGKELVSHLVMLGTPNGGSELAKIAKFRDMASMLLTLAVNTGFGFPAAATILGVLAASKNLTVTLEQMGYEHDSGFLKYLEQAPDPHVRYSMLAGSLEGFLGKNKEAERLVNKVWDFVADRFYEEPNDIAVSVKSIRNVPTNRHPKPHCADVECHHLNYFTEKHSLDVLTGLLRSEQQHKF